MKAKTTMKMVLITLLASAMTFCQPIPTASEQAVSIPIDGNTYVTQRSEIKGSETNDKEITLSSWFKVSTIGSLNLYLKSEAVKAETKLEIIVGKKSFKVKLNENSEMPLFVGKIDVKEAGYIRIDMKFLESQNPKAIEWLIDGEAAKEPLAFVRNFTPYWGLRGPSVHMKYTLPKEDVEYFYNEITIPEGEDKIGSYFMTNGFGEGYCGIQVNSKTERRILFSVWSPFSTDNPKSIPLDQQVVLLEKGPDVNVGEFGNEGSGGQSFRRYNWKAAETYKILTRVHPNEDKSTTYTAWFFNPESQEWDIIASFKRPKTHTWYTGAHSFLENFAPSQGYLGRSVLFSNQWARTTSGEWIELTEGGFTCDATASAGVRMDYAGGVKDGAFYLQNGGFFNTPTKYGTKFTREATNKKPQIDVNKDL